MIIKAGAIIISSVDKNKIALLYRGKWGDWTFPKGHTENNETAVETMIRELHEETGLNVNVIKELPDLIYDTVREKDCVVKFFLTQSIDDTQLKLEFPEDIVEWVNYNDVHSKITYDNLCNYYALVMPEIIEYINSK